MVFNSLSFLLFFPVVVLLYFVIPHKRRYIWLLAASYYFYMCWNVKYVLLILFSTFVTYLSGRFIDFFQRRSWEEDRIIMWKKLCVAVSFILNLSILFFFKYFDFVFTNLSRLFSLIHIELNHPNFDIILPVGISFYTFQALSYTIDVYRKEIPVEKDFLHYALFVSFFPQLVAGPIEKSKNLLGQFYEVHRFDYQRIKDGLLLMLWGFFMKMVIADRAAILVDQVYNNWYNHNGLAIIAATVLFAIQIYCDFGSYSNIAVGAAQVMGFRLMENFRQPYFATSVADFWRRWHISLSTWFRDYLYIPLGGNRKGKFRKSCNLMIVFLVSGLWHGANWNFVIWGCLNGMYQVIGEVAKPLQNKILLFFRINRNCFSYRLMQQIITFILIDFTWLFFRANGFITGLRMIKHMVSNISTSMLVDGTWFGMGLNGKNLTVLLLSIILLFLVDHYHAKGSVRRWLDKQNLIFRWIMYYALIFAIIIFGVYGLGYDAVAFIYFRF